MKTKHRKAARGKQQRKYGADPMASLNLLRMCAPADVDDQLLLETPVLEAFARLRDGAGTRADFNNVNDAIQCAGSACAYFERQEDADLQIELINRGASAMQRMRDRWVSHQVLRFDGQGMQDAREAINIYIEFLGTLTRKQMRDAFAFAMREERKAA